MKTFRFTLLALAAAVLAFTSCKKDGNDTEPEAPRSVWDGTAAAPAGMNTSARTLTIASAANLAWISENIADYTNFEGYTFTQTIDIDLASLEWAPIGNDDTPFGGTYDGGGHRIFNLKVTGGTNDYQGLFGFCMSGTLKNIHIASGTVEGDDEVGAICGMARYSVFIGCSNAATVLGGEWGVGGICGQLDRGSLVTSCTNQGAVSAEEAVGGIAGECNESLIRGCANMGTVASTEEGAACYYYAAGIAGYVCQGSMVTGCRNSGTISCLSASSPKLTDSGIGGIVGQLATNTYQLHDPSIISACYSTGTFDVPEACRAITGQICGSVYDDGSIENCYASAAVSASGSVVGPMLGMGAEQGTPPSQPTYIISQFGASAWPTASLAGWGPTKPMNWDDLDCCEGVIWATPWASLGGWNGGSPDYPSL